MLKRCAIMFLLILATGCGGGMHTRGSPEIDESYSTPWGNVTITKDAFIFGSDFPSDIAIPDIDGMRDTAFVVSFSSPSGVLAIDLEANPLALSSKFAGLISPEGTGMPGSLFIASTSRAFLLTSSHVIDFNPTTGGVNTTFKLLGQLTLDEYLPISAAYDVDGDGTAESTIKTINMNFPASLAVTQGKLYITMSNLISPIMPAVAAPGVVRIFNITESSPYLAEAKTPVLTTDFNPTGVTLLPDGLIAITNSGVSDIWDGAAHPLTNSSIDFLDPGTDEIIDNVSLGSASLSFQELAVTSDGGTAYTGSASFGEVYAVDLVNRQALHTRENPITITSNIEGSDYLSSQALSYDNWYLFMASFDNSSIYPVDVSVTPPDVLPTTFPNPFVLGFPKGVTPENPTGTNTGIGAVAVRPGIPGVDYTGPDIFALTGSPGTMVTINTHGTGEGTSLQIKNMEISPNLLEIEEINEAFQLYLNIEFADGSSQNDITSTFTNPYSSYPVRVQWSSSNSDVALIDSSAMVTPKSLGETIITAQIGQRSASARLIISSGQSTPSESASPDNENGGQPDDNPPNIFIPNITLYINPAVAEAILNILKNVPFADEVVEFNPGPGAGFGSSKMPGIVLGPPKGAGDMMGSLDVVSLGYKGEIILEMTDFIIADGEGPDFTVFENPFYAGGNPNAPFSEPGIVSASDDGETFYEFECNLSDKPLYPGCAGTKPTYSNPDNGIDPTDPEVSGGNQFDLAEIGLATARFIKIVDGGKGWGGGTTAGFDLDAIAVINGVLPEEANINK